MMSTVGDLVNETRENIPLKHGKKQTNWRYCNEECFSGLKYINIAFGTLTCVITFALLIQIYYGDYQVIPHGSVATDSLECSKVGTSILKKGGNAIDAAIASAFCLAVVTPHVTGLDAEGQLLIYNHKTRLVPNVIDFSGATGNLPPLILGLAYTHQQYGSLAWKDLVQPAVEIARDGYLISKMLVQAVVKAKAEDLYGHLETGQILKHENLTVTLNRIANMPEKELYSYLDHNQTTISQAVKLTFNGYDIYVPSTHSIGLFVIKNLQLIESFNFTTEDTIKPEYIYRLAESTKMFYERTNLGTQFHEGTLSNIAVMDMEDNYVSLVTGMYELFGSGEMTVHGYVLDIKNKDKPCSRVPLIIVDNSIICGRRMVFGADHVAVATQMVTSLLIANENATESIEAPRLHILTNGTIGIEGSHTPSFNEDALKYLETLTPNLMLLSEPYPSSNIVEKIKDDLTSHSDSRGGGIASRF